MYKGILHTHTLVVTLFFLIYVIKTILLLGNRTDLLQKFTKAFKIPEMIISVLFLVTGIYLAMQLPFGGKFDYLFWIKLAMVFAAIPIAIIGFKKSNKVLAALSLLLITGSYGLAEVYSKKKGVPAEKIIVDNTGFGLYEANCARCHGTEGNLGLAGAFNLKKTEMNVEQMKEVILKGKKMMPPVAIDESQAQAIAEYVSSTIKGK